MKRKRRSLNDMMLAAEEHARDLRRMAASLDRHPDIATGRTAGSDAECFEDIADLIATIIPVKAQVGRILATVTIKHRADHQNEVPESDADPPPADQGGEEDGGEE